MSWSKHLWIHKMERSYFMPTLPQNTAPPSSVVSFSNPKPAFDLEDYDSFSPEKLIKSQDTVNVGLLSFQAVFIGARTLFCTLWLGRMSPAHVPDIVIFLDAITIASEEEASKGRPPLSLPIASIGAINGHSLPDVALRCRRGEEHSFILKLATMRNKYHKGNSEMVPYSRTGSAAPKKHMMSSICEGTMGSSTVNQFAVLVSCRCNYTESKLFFKHLKDWRPHGTRDLMISITSVSKANW